MNKATLALLDSDFSKHPVLIAGPASEDKVSEIEAFAGFPLPSDYKAFIERYGGAIVGPYSVFGFGASDAMADDESSVIQVTERFRSQRWPGTQEDIVISMDHAGNPITLDRCGHIHRFDHDSGVSENISDSFEGFIKWCLAK